MLHIPEACLSSSVYVGLFSCSLLPGLKGCSAYDTASALA